MRPPIRNAFVAVLAGLLFCVVFASRSFAQTSPASPSPQNNAEPSAQAPAPAPSQPATKKVWTNDDVMGLRADSRISTFKQPRTKPAANGTKPPNSRARTAAWYQNRIAGLQAQLPHLDDQIGQLQAALNGDTVNSVRKWGGVKPDDWRVELDTLQKKRDGIQAEISLLEDQARHDGVPAGALP
ncbi:MAG TPA: hypothetical protein VMD77_12140 [Candidatus Baltobacteraceae bacterium]|nr:hypothetical protein [Candidatus Baltobacteraceae bacterium]